MSGFLPLLASPAVDPNHPPASCFAQNAAGQLPTCTFSGGHWTRSYGGGGFGDPTGGGGDIAGLFVFGFVIVALLAVGGFIYRINAARRMARNAGIDEGDAIAMTLTSRDGLAATYLAANLRRPTEPPVTSSPTATAPAPRGTAAQRLAKLTALLDEGLIDQDEYAARRRAVIDSV